MFWFSFPPSKPRSGERVSFVWLTQSWIRRCVSKWEVSARTVMPPITANGWRPLFHQKVTQNSKAWGWRASLGWGDGAKYHGNTSEQNMSERYVGKGKVSWQSLSEWHTMASSDTRSLTGKLFTFKCTSKVLWLPFIFYLPSCGCEIRGNLCWFIPTVQSVTCKFISMIGCLGVSVEIPTYPSVCP